MFEELLAGGEFGVGREAAKRGEVQVANDLGVRFCGCVFFHREQFGDSARRVTDLVGDEIAVDATESALGDVELTTFFAASGTP